MATDVANESTVLACFPRRNRQTGRDEQVRVAASDWNGRIFLHLRTWFAGRPEGPGDDGFRPTRFGVAVRETELDDLAAAIEEARRLVHAEGRATSQAPAGRPRRPTN